MTATIMGPEIFNFLFFLFVFIIGLDYLWSGYLVITNRANDKRNRRLLGLWIIQRIHIPENKKKIFGGHMNFLYNFRNMGFMALASGIL